MAAATPTHVVICLDNSGSMKEKDAAEEGDSGGVRSRRRCDAAQNAARKLLSDLVKVRDLRTLVSVLLFNDHPTVRVSAARLTQAVAESACGTPPPKPRNGTNYSVAWEAVETCIADAQRVAAGEPFAHKVIFLSDGRPGELNVKTPAFCSEPQTSKYRKQVRPSAPAIVRRLCRAHSGKFSLFAIGVGNEEMDWLQRLTKIATAEGAEGQFDMVGAAGTALSAIAPAPAPMGATDAPGKNSEPPEIKCTFKVGDAVQLAPYANSRDILKPGAVGVVAAVHPTAKTVEIFVDSPKACKSMYRAGNVIEMASQGGAAANSVRRRLLKGLLAEATSVSPGSPNATDVKRALLHRAKQVEQRIASSTAKVNAGPTCIRSGLSRPLQPIAECDSESPQSSEQCSRMMMPPPPQVIGATRQSTTLLNAFNSISSSITSSMAAANPHRRLRPYYPEHGHAWKSHIGWVRYSADRLRTENDIDSWESVPGGLWMRENPFAKGGQRNAYHVGIGSRPSAQSGHNHYVAKESRWEGDDASGLAR